ncbi:JmjC domain-containing protein [Chryseobacterium fistulae]|uniref:JmjC domain-containing protein n=1 Tax=Chryseobacterium fistulae TaxID=2675058 RepID=A0A6N4XZ97_9FLAO|nr:cupin domain-containing protein [Chryseobacterium fistulae]CAA7393037.1 hypothetical protein CHRY9393_03450 [Chryseobacterium fistulae]
MDIFRTIQENHFEKSPFTKSIKGDLPISFTYDDFQDILVKLIDQSPDSIQITKNGKLVFPNLFTKTISYPEIIRDYREGATITVNFISSFNSSLKKICEQMEHIFECPVECSAFLTPPNVQGFSPHFDSAEVFMVQIEGSKHWKIYSPILDLPLERQKAIVSDKIFETTPLLDTTLEKDSILYIPRGFIHYGHCNETEPSLHITFGLVLNRKYELAQLFIEELAEFFPSFRKSIQYSEITAENIHDILTSSLASLKEHELSHEIVLKIKAKIKEQNIKQSIILPDNDLLWNPSLDLKNSDIYRKRKNLKFSLHNQNLIFNSLNGTKNISLPLASLEIVDHILTNEEFSIHSISHHINDVENIKNVLKKFMSENVIVKKAL